MISIDAKRRLSDWFRQWRLPLRRFLLRRAGVLAADVEDVGQEVFLRLMRYETAELIEHPQAYLYKVASNVATEWSMRARNRQSYMVPTGRLRISLQTGYTEGPTFGDQGTKRLESMLNAMFVAMHRLVVKCWVWSGGMCGGARKRLIDSGRQSKK